MLSREKLIYLVENLSVNVGNNIFIHHPITEEIVLVCVEKIKTTTLVVSIPEDSEYYGQPNFEIKKYEILSIK